MEEMKFKTGQEVLVRDTFEDVWCYALYSHYLRDDTNYPHVTAGQRSFHFCINYKGNENLVGTTDKPKKDLPIGTPVMACNILADWRFGYYAGNGSISTRKENISGIANIYLINMKYIISIDKFDFNNPENSLKYNIVK